MLDFLFTGWGAFWMLLAMLIPFILMFFYIMIRKGIIDPNPSATPRRKLSRLEGIWLSAVFFIFVGVNLASLKFMPTIATARAAVSGEPIQDIELTARSWSFEFSDTEIRAGTTVRFRGTSVDTQHGFALYHPDGNLLLTMILMPGVSKPSEIVYTFKDPGRYKVRCLEYCGIIHHAMMSELTVVASN